MIINGDCLEVMKGMEDNSISGIVTDPPYGLSFMGKGWDHEVPGVLYWAECLRIIQPGGFLLSMGGSRTSHRLTSAIEDSGFEIRDCIMWIYGSGFPKSHNNFGINGYGTALKPAYEPIIMAMKPCDGTFKQNAEKWGQAGINIDGCRIGIDGGTKRANQPPYPKKEDGTEDRSQHWARIGVGCLEINKGRWPANVIFDEEAAKMLDEQSGELKSGSIEPHHKFKKDQINTYGKYNAKTGISSSGSSGGASRFFYNTGRIHENEICRHFLQEEKIYRNEEYSDSEYGRSCKNDRKSEVNNTIQNDNQNERSRIIYCAKTSSKERNEGLEGMPDIIGKRTLDGGKMLTGSGNERNNSGKNNHPTVKPLKLMKYLITLIMPPKDGILLDPFAGSGSTILAAHQLGFKAIGIEKSPEYCEIARKRIENWKPEIPEPDLFENKSA